MLSESAGNLSLSFQPTKAGLCLAIGWKCHANWFVLNKLKKGEPCQCPTLAYGSECTALCYSLYELISAKLMGDAKAQEASKVLSVDCNCNSTEFFLTIHCGPSMSILRKVLSVTMKFLQPEKLFPAYKENLKILNGKPQRDEFDYSAKELRASLDAGVHVAAFGKVNLDSEKMKKIVDAASAKYTKPAKALPAGKKPDSLSVQPGESQYPVIKVPNAALGSALVNFFASVHERAVVGPHGVIVYKCRWAPSALLVKRLHGWAGPRFGKMKDVAPALAYLACTSGNAGPSVVAAAKKKMSPAEMEKALADALK